MKPVCAIPLLFALTVSAAEPKAKPVPAEHRPFLTWIKALRDSDVESFKSVYSTSMQKSMARKGWKKMLAKYEKDMTAEFGDFKVEEFSLSFEPRQKKNDEGKLRITFKGKKLPSFGIVREKGVWKLDEY
jgi:hypothetical protein